ncbi:hypothetical protein AB8880_04900 [Alphaproteobacteria bacterium LSUCC0684]
MGNVFISHDVGIARRMVEEKSKFSHHLRKKQKKSLEAHCHWPTCDQDFLHQENLNLHAFR